MKERKHFIAGSTGVVGQAVVRLADSRKLPVVPHLRPKAGRPAQDSRACVLELSDTAGLTSALSACSTVFQLIGTIRKRFSSGDTYETSDIGTTAQLVEAAKAAGIDHFVLLSAVGAGSPMGAYLKAKARAEALVMESGIPYSIFRPSVFVGEGRKAPPLMGAVTRLLGLDRYRPIAVEQLAAALLNVAIRREPLGTILEGASLWRAVGDAP